MSETRRHILTFCFLDSVLFHLPESNLILHRYWQQWVLHAYYPISRQYENDRESVYLSTHLRVCVGLQVANNLEYPTRRNHLKPYLYPLKSRLTCSAEMPFTSARFTLSRVICPTTRFGKRERRETNRFRTDVWSGLSMFHS